MILFVGFNIAISDNNPTVQKLKIIKFPQFDKLLCKDESCDYIEIENMSDFSCEIDSIIIKGPSAGEFIIDSNSEIDVDDYGKVKIRICFVPKSDGIKFAEAVLYSEDLLYGTNNKLSFQLVGEKYSSKLEIRPNEIDFGTVEIGSPNIIEFKIINTGSIPHKFFQLPYKSGKFSIEKIVPEELFPGDTAVATCKLIADEIGQFSTSFNLKDVCQNEYKIRCQAKVRAEKPAEKIILKVENIEANSGEKVSLSISVSNRTFLLSKNKNVVYTQVDFNPTILHPINNTPLGEIIGGKRSIALELPLTYDSVFTFDFNVALGDDSVSSLRLHDTYIPDYDIDIQNNSGVFRLLNLCEAAGPRLVKFEDSINMIYKSTNQDFAELSFQLIENGNTRVYLFDYNGNPVAKIVDENLTKGSYQKTINLHNISSGFYFVKFDTPTFSKVFLVNVIR